MLRRLLLLLLLPALLGLGLAHRAPKTTADIALAAWVAEGGDAAQLCLSETGHDHGDSRECGLCNLAGPVDLPGQGFVAPTTLALAAPHAPFRAQAPRRAPVSVHPARAPPGSATT